MSPVLANSTQNITCNSIIISYSIYSISPTHTIILVSMPPNDHLASSNYPINFNAIYYYYLVLFSLVTLFILIYLVEFLSNLRILSSLIITLIYLIYSCLLLPPDYYLMKVKYSI